MGLILFFGDGHLRRPDKELDFDESPIYGLVPGDGVLLELDIAPRAHTGGFYEGLHQRRRVSQGGGAPGSWSIKDGRMVGPP